MSNAEHIEQAHAAIAKACMIPERLLRGEASSEGEMTVRNAEYLEYIVKVQDEFATRTRIRWFGLTNRQRVYMNLKGETFTYLRPSRGFAKHNRRTKQERKR